MKNGFFNCEGKRWRYMYFIIAGLLIGGMFGGVLVRFAGASQYGTNIGAYDYADAFGLPIANIVDVYEWDYNQTVTGYIDYVNVVVYQYKDLNDLELYVNGTSFGYPDSFEEIDLTFPDHKMIFNWSAPDTGFYVNGKLVFEMVTKSTEYKWAVGGFQTGSSDLDGDGDATFGYYYHEGDTANTTYVDGVMSYTGGAGHAFRTNEIGYNVTIEDSLVNCTTYGSDYCFTFCDLKEDRYLKYYDLSYTGTILDMDYIKAGIMINGEVVQYNDEYDDADDGSYGYNGVHFSSNFENGLNSVYIYDWGGSELTAYVNDIPHYMKTNYTINMLDDSETTIFLLRADDPVTDDFTETESAYYNDLYGDEYAEFYNQEIDDYYSLGDYFYIVYNLTDDHLKNSTDYYVELTYDAGIVLDSFLIHVGHKPYDNGIIEITDYLIVNTGGYQIKVYAFNDNTSCKEDLIYTSEIVYVRSSGGVESGGTSDFQFYNFVAGFGLVFGFGCAPIVIFRRNNFFQNNGLIVFLIFCILGLSISIYLSLLPIWMGILVGLILVIILIDRIRKGA